VAAVLLALIGAGVIIADTLRQHKQQPSAPSKITTTVQQSSVSILRTEYFQFQAPADWVEISNQSTSQKFVYREIKNTLIQNQLDIYVNNSPKELFAEYVLPVKVKDDRMGLEAGEISEHCKKAVPKPLNSNSLSVTYQGVTFGCHLSGTAFIVVAGQKGGTTDIRLIRPNGQAITYTLVYRDLTADPTGDDFVGILNSFQAR
jgi:hypothetical protein